jgi:methylmalonyl-CoA/ethylmalonyl-CoA epimerase
LLCELEKKNRKKKKKKGSRKRKKKVSVFFSPFNFNFFYFFILVFSRLLRTTTARCIASSSQTASLDAQRYSTKAASSPWQLKVGRLNHVAIAVPDLESATRLYADVLGGKCSAPLALPEHGVTTVFVELPNTKIELLHPLGDKSPISNFLAKNAKGGIHHICLEVDDVDRAIADLIAKGIKVLGKESKIGAHGKPVVFLHPADFNGVLIELEKV